MLDKIHRSFQFFKNLGRKCCCHSLSLQSLISNQDFKKIDMCSKQLMACVDINSQYKRDLNDIILKYKNNEIHSHRLWRYIHHEHMNKITEYFVGKYKLKYMETVEKILQNESQIRHNKVPMSHLENIDLILFLDIENWSFFKSLADSLPPNVYCFIFKSETSNWRPPNNLAWYDELVKNKMVQVCNANQRKNAADFALTLEIGKQEIQLPSRIAFLIVSGDFGLLEVIRQTKESKRIIGLVDPHFKQKMHKHTKLQDANHLLDIIKITKYMAIRARFDEIIVNAEISRSEINECMKRMSKDITY